MVQMKNNCKISNRNRIKSFFTIFIATARMYDYEKRSQKPRREKSPLQRCTRKLIFSLRRRQRSFILHFELFEFTDRPEGRNLRWRENSLLQRKSIRRN